MDIEKVVAEIEDALSGNLAKAGYVYKMSLYGLKDKALTDALALLKEQELPTELKQKMWNAFYAEEDEYEKKFVGKEEHLNWFTVYRPWLQKGFDIAINAIADWEGR